MDHATLETLRRHARRCHELSRLLASPADRSALHDYAAVLNQQAADLERNAQAPRSLPPPETAPEPYSAAIARGAALAPLSNRPGRAPVGSPSR